MITFTQAFLLALLYWISNGSWLTLAGKNLNFPVVSGFFIGLIMGDPIGGTILGGTIQTLNMAPSQVGSIITMDLKMASFITIPMALAANLDTQTILAFAVPFTVLGAFLSRLCRTLNQFGLALQDKFAAKGSTGGMYFVTIFMERLIEFPIYFGLMFVCLYFGRNAMSVLLNAVPDWLMLTFITLAKFLPAIGFAMFLKALNDKKYLPMFFMGFYIWYFLGSSLSLIGITIFGALLGIMVVTQNKDKNQAEAGGAK